MTDAKVDAYMPLWIGAYLADTLTFTTAQHGAYLLLLMAYWRERAPLADDDEDLAGITKLSRNEWKHMRPKLAKKFQVADGVWRHKRVEQELAGAMQRKEKASRKAKSAAEARWGKGGEHHSGDAPSMPQAMHEDCPTPTPTPPLSEGSEPKGSAVADAPPVDNSNPGPQTPDHARRAVWRDCGRWMVDNGVAEVTAREVMGLVLKDHPATALGAMQAAPKAGPTIDPKGWLIATAKRLAGEQKTVPSDAAEKTQALLAQRALTPEEQAASTAARIAASSRLAALKVARV